jgi:hypothetical protein
MQVDEVSRAMMEDHGELLGAIRAVEAMVDSASRATGDVARRLHDLAELWEAHVVEEEAAPLYTEYAERYAPVAGELTRLKASHPVMLGELRSLARACDSAETLELDSPLSIRIRTAIATLRQHEASEAAAIQRIRVLALGPSMRP